MGLENETAMIHHLRPLDKLYDQSWISNNTSLRALQTNMNINKKIDRVTTASTKFYSKRLFQILLKYLLKLSKITVASHTQKFHSGLSTKCCRVP
jgi:hypothetical protein